MIQPDYRGARGSNAGDDFHELWALRQALVLIDPEADLAAITVEGLRAEDEEGKPLDTWDGVDCTLYYGGDHAATANRIVIAQLKYSAANPDQPWTVTRLTHSTNKRQDNSVIGRLAKAFAGLTDKRPDLVGNGNIAVRLVSNQPIDLAVGNALSELSTSPDRATLLTSSGLQKLAFEMFAKALDLSEFGRGSRFGLEERVLATISEWTDDDARAALDHLMRFVRRAMMPEAKGDVITRESILLCFGFSDPAALFPCPSAIKRVDRVIPREASQTVADRMKHGDQRICLHGGGGSGKTTALQEIAGLLPSESVVIVFDCYGNGRYLDSDAYRHRPPDAFLQLSNDLARKLRMPLLLSRSGNLDYPRVFKKRLERAAELVASRCQEALLVIIVDAADNSITAASTRSPPERSFVHDFISLGDLPMNVRFVVTARTGRLETLELPHGFKLTEIKGFDREETAAHVRGVWNDAPDTWIEDFHHLSGGNPRVQQYALKYAGTEVVKALDYLRPHGKGLDQVFREQLEYALHKEGHDQDIKAFCAGLVALPRPVPLADLSAITNLTIANLRDLCADLAPGVRLTNDLVSFADEDFEQFVRVEAEAQLVTTQIRIANYFVSRHKSDAYAANHVAAALLAAHRGQEIIDLVNAEREPKAINDPVLRRGVQLQRLQIAMKVCREAANIVDAMLTLLIGAEALKTEDAIRRTLIENPDLAASFARESSGRMILRDAEEIANHGPLLFHLMVADARGGDSVSVREGHRHVGAWLQRRNEHFEEEKKRYPNSEPRDWPIDARDIAAQTEAVLRVVGPQQAVKNVLRWSPKSLALSVASILSLKLITSGEVSLVERCITEAPIRAPWDLFLLTPLALAGKNVDLARLEFGLAKLLRRGLIRLDRLVGSWRDDFAINDYFETILTACELIVARGGDRVCVASVLEQFAKPELRRRDRIYTSRVSVIDFTLRAHALLERLAGRKTSVEMYLVDPPDPSGDLSPEKLEQHKRSDEKDKEELRGFIGPLVGIYDIRAQALIGSISSEEASRKLRDTIGSLNEREYRFSTHHDSLTMRRRAALSISRLMAIAGLDRRALLECSISLLGSRPDLFGSGEAGIFENLALDWSLHQTILQSVTIRGKAVRELKASAEEKVTALVRLARLLLPISFADAAAFFNQAIEVAGEIDEEAIHEISLFAPLATRAVDSMNVNQRRAVASDLAIVVSDTAVRLEGHDHFPWVEVAEALSTLDLSFALAAAGRWEDANIVGRPTFLPPILETGLIRHEISSRQVAALLPLLDKLNKETIGRIVTEANTRKGDLDLNTLSEELAKEELLRFGHGIRNEVFEKLNSLLINGKPGLWLDRLLQATRFHQVETPSQLSPTLKQEKTPQQTMREAERKDPCDTIDWQAYRFVSAKEVEDVIGTAIEAARTSDTYVSVSAVFDKMRSVVTLGDRRAHLDALVDSTFSKVSDYELAHAVTKGVLEWRGTLAVDNWCRERLMNVVVEQLPGFSRFLGYDRRPLPDLLEKSGVPDQQIAAALIEGLERHVDTLNAPTIYALVGLVGKYCLPTEAAQVITRYANRLVQRITPSDREKWDTTDVPTNIAESMARYLYALMGDVDVRSRWRAAHAIRSLVRLGDFSVIDGLLPLYDRTSEVSYRLPDAPFYWLAARLWLMITLDRISDETPLAVKTHGKRILKIATDDNFPHILVRAFAKSAVSKLVATGIMHISSTQRKALKRANTSQVPRKKARSLSYNVGFDKYAYKQREERRFHFNTMDTLPYWYSRAMRHFADVDRETFLDAAERWIVDRWGVRNNPWQWDQEPRKATVL